MVCVSSLEFEGLFRGVDGGVSCGGMVGEMVLWSVPYSFVRVT